MLVPLAAAAEKESAAPTQSFMRFANELTFAALKEGKGTISTAKLSEHATAGSVWGQYGVRPLFVDCFYI